MVTSSKEVGAAVGGGVGYSAAEVILWAVDRVYAFIFGPCDPAGCMPDNVEAALMVCLVAAAGYFAAWLADENQPLVNPAA